MTNQRQKGGEQSVNLQAGRDIVVVTDGQLKARAHARYLVCDSIHLLTRLREELESVPTENRAFIFENNVSDFWVAATKLPNAELPTREESPETSLQEYLRDYPEAHVEYDDSPYFSTTRPLRAEELEFIRKGSSLQSLMIEHGIDPSVFSVDAGRSALCGTDDSEFSSSVSTHPIWGVLLEVVVGEGFLPLTHATGRRRDKLDVASLVSAFADAPPITVSLPKMQLRASQSLLVPVFTLVPPTLDFIVPTGTVERSASRFGEYFSLHSVEIESARPELQVWGPGWIPSSITYRTDGAHEQRADIHEFDRQLLIHMGQHWQMGSCPHLFGIDGNSHAMYVGSPFLAGGAVVDQTFETVVSCGIQGMILAELEHEETFIREITVDGVRVAEDLVLREGEQFEFDVHEGGVVAISGFYRLLPGAIEGNAEVRKRVIQRFERVHNHGIRTAHAQWCISDKSYSTESRPARSERLCASGV